MKKFFALFSVALLTMSAWAANTYVKVTSIDQLEAGQKYIIVNEEASVALGAITGTSTNYGSSVAITIDNGVIDLDETDAVELTLGEGSMDALGHDTWTFDIGGGGHYLCWASGNSLNTVNSPSPNNAMWIASSTDDGIVLTSKVDNTRKLQYNASSPRFACYTSNQKPAVLYVQGVPGDEGIANLNEANGLEDDVNFTFSGNAVVTVQHGNYLFVRDETGFGMIYGAVDGTFVNGQVLSPGWSATKTSNDGWVKFTDPAGFSASGETNAELGAAIELTGTPDESLLNAYVYVKGVNKGFLTIRNIPLPDGTTIGITDILWAMGQEASGCYNIYGIICKVDGVLKFNLVKWEAYVEPAFLRGDVDDNGEVKIADVTALISYLLSGDDTSINLQAADCDQNGEIKIADVTALINYLLTGSW